MTIRTDPAKRRLHLARPEAKPSVAYSRLRRAARMFRGSYAPKAERHRLIVRWLAAVDKLGDKSLLATPVQRKVA
jgi:hypothetical protein